MATIKKSRTNPSKSQRLQSLKSGRPPLLLSKQSTTTPISNSQSLSSSQSISSSLSSKLTRTVIRTHHTLLKRLTHARTKSPNTAENQALIQQLESQIEANGGLELYQRASTTGQSKTRGGDTSWVLVNWLKEAGYLKSEVRSKSANGGAVAPQTQSSGGNSRLLRVLEVGALSTKNALNVPGMEVRRIDLRSQEEGIEEMDFMDLPLPMSLSTKNGDTMGVSRKRKHNGDHVNTNVRDQRRRDLSDSSSDFDASSFNSDSEQHSGSEPTSAVPVSNKNQSSNSSAGTNAILQYPLLEQTPGNQQGSEDTDFYDIISLSLVVNFVPDSRLRGEMLRRTTKFLASNSPRPISQPSSSSTATNGTRKTATITSKTTATNIGSNSEFDRNSTDTTSPYPAKTTPTETQLLPALFLVLPLPCVSNSRYLDEKRLTAIMTSLGYTLTRVKRSAKLYYSFWHYDHLHNQMITTTRKTTAFKKEEIRGGKDRNNFCIVLQ